MANHKLYIEYKYIPGAYPSFTDIADQTIDLMAIAAELGRLNVDVRTLGYTGTRYRKFMVFYLGSEKDLTVAKLSCHQLLTQADFERIEMLEKAHEELRHYLQGSQGEVIELEEHLRTIKNILDPV